MRRVTLAVLVPATLGLATVVGSTPGCSTDGQATQPNGPVFDAGNGGPDSATDHVPDGHFVSDLGAVRDAPADQNHVEAAKPDVSAPNDSGAEATTSHLEAGSDAADGTVAEAAADAGTETGADASACPSGSGTIAVLGGAAGVAFGTWSIKGAPFVAPTSFANESAEAQPAIATVGAKLVSVFPLTTTTYLESSVFATSAPVGWATPTQIGIAGVDAGAPASGAPALGGPNVVYRGTNSLFYRGIFSGTTWGPASDPVGGSASTDTGPSAPAAAVASGTLYVAFDGSNNGLYVDSSSGAGQWAGAEGISGAGVGSVPPTLLALTGDSSDLMLLFEEKTTSSIYSVVHAAGGAWSAPVLVDSTAVTAEQVSAAPTANGGGRAHLPRDGRSLLLLRVQSYGLSRVDSPRLHLHECRAELRTPERGDGRLRVRRCGDNRPVEWRRRLHLVRVDVVRPDDAQRHGLHELRRRRDAALSVITSPVGRPRQLRRACRRFARSR